MAFLAAGVMTLWAEINVHTNLSQFSYPNATVLEDYYADSVVVWCARYDANMSVEIHFSMAAYLPRICRTLAAG